CFGILRTRGDRAPSLFGGRCYSWCYFGAPIEPLDGVVELPRREVRVALGHARGGVTEEVADVLMSTPCMRGPDAKLCRRSFHRRLWIWALRKAGVKTRPTECLPSSGPDPMVFGNTHGLLRREGRARSTATRSSLIGT